MPAAADPILNRPDEIRSCRFGLNEICGSFDETHGTRFWSVASATVELDFASGISQARATATVGRCRQKLVVSNNYVV